MKLTFTLIALCSYCLLHAQKAGTLDKSFGDSGKVLISFNNTELQCFASAIQKDNKTIVVGEYDSASNNFFLNGFLVLRYLPSGVLDKSFGNNGRVIINFGYDLQVADAVVVQEDGKIVITGYSVSGFFDVNYDIPMARLNTDGSLDSSFGNNGKVITDFSDGDNASSVCLQEDGKIIVGGYYNKVDFLLIRYNTNGSLDSSFGNKGKVIKMFSEISSIASVAIQPDGKIVAGGLTDARNSKFEIGRYNSNGTPDSAFGINGFVTTDYGANSDQIFKIIIQPDKKIIAVGGTGLNFDTKHEYIAVARYKSNGDLDSTFGINGKSTLQYPNERATGYNAVLQSDDKLIVTGPLTSNIDVDYLLVRLKTDGSIDSSFGTNGSVITDFSELYDVPWGIGIRSDNIIVAAGSSQLYDPTSIFDVSLAAYNEFGKKQIIIQKIKHYIATHNDAQATTLNKVSIYPNPAQNILHVEGLSSQNAKLTVVDFNGNVIVSRELSVVSNGYDLNVSSLHAGNYLLKIETNGEVVTKQFVKE